MPSIRRQQMSDTIIPGNLPAHRTAVTGALLVGMLFLLCWLAALAGLEFTHQFLQLFTPDTVGTPGAFTMGILCALLGGAVGGALLAFLWNGVGRLGIR
jgi:hypothetical protein